MQPSGEPAGEPKDGDFVAYLEQIEKRQLAALPERVRQHLMLDATHAPGTKAADRAAEANTAAGADAVLPHFAAGAEQRKRLVRAALFALFGLFLTVYALLGDGGILALLIGLVLLWRAAVSLRRAMSISRPALPGGGRPF
jgi:hypothetical protein